MNSYKIAFLNSKGGVEKSTLFICIRLIAKTRLTEKLN